MVEVGQNAKLQFHWKVNPYDYSTEKVETLITKIAKKYNVSRNNVKVIPDFIMLNEKNEKITISNDLILNIQNPEFQIKLFQEYLEMSTIENYDFDFIKKIDNEINGSINYEAYDKFRRYSIKWLRWSNFLSYGQDNFFDFTTLKGLVLLNGEPANQSGKTTFAIDLLHFLLFGKTDKASVQEKIFNKFLKEETEVTVEGCIEIEGEEYIIKRTLSRPQLAKRTKKSKTSQKVEYYKIVNSEYEELVDFIDNQQEENSIKTNKVIKEAIGNENDFDLIICATLSNLDDLIEKKDTERGRILSRWIGLLPIEEKETVAKEHFNTQIKPYLLSNRYNTETLLQERDAYMVRINDHKTQIDRVVKDVEKLNKDIETIEKNKELLLSAKQNIDTSLTKIDYQTLLTNIDKLVDEGKKKKSEIDYITSEIDKIGDVDFSEVTYNQLNQKRLELTEQIAIIKTKFNNGKQQIEYLEKSEYCPTCGKKLDNVDNSIKINELKKELDIFRENGIKYNNDLKEVTEAISNMSQAMENFKIKSKLIIQKSALEVQIEQLRGSAREKLQVKKEYEKNEDAIKKNNEIDINLRNYDIILNGYRNSKEQNIVFIEKLNGEIESFKTNIKTIEETIDKIKEEEHLVRNWKIYLDLVGKNGIVKMVLRRAIPIINAQIKYLLNDICDFDLEIEITEKNEINFYIIKDNVKSDISSGSGFEKTVSALALRFVLAKNSVIPRMSYIVLDECFGRVAQENYDNIKTLLDRVQDEYNSIIIVSHLDEIKEWCSQCITVSKNTQGVSFLKTENS